MELIYEKIKALRTEILGHENLYYNLGCPEISDMEFDRLMSRLAQLEKDNPDYASPYSPTQRVGGTPLKEFETIKHNSPMLSVGNTYSEEELNDFNNRVVKALDGKQPSYIIEPKIDGIAISLQYEKGYLVRALTRGDGEYGDDVTLNVKTIKLVPLKLETDSPPDFLEVRGEIFMPKSVFNRINDQREVDGVDLFANTRNAASGTMKLLDPREVDKRSLSMFVHTITDSGEWDSNTDAYIDLIGWGFKVVNFNLRHTMEEIIKDIESWDKKRHEVDYDIDGVVLKLDNLRERKILGFRSKSPRWIIAYKYKAEEVITTLKDIELGVGRIGTITPRAVLEPVTVSGSTVSYATLHNFDEIRKKDFRIGDKVVVVKAGEIIPQVVRSLVEERDGTEQKWTPSMNCPCCGSTIEKIEGEVAFRCINLSCKAQLKKRIEHFVSRAAMDIEGIGKAVIDGLVDNDLVKNLSDIYELSAQDLALLDRTGEKTINNLLIAIKASKSKSPVKLLYGLGIHHVGAHVAEILMDGRKNLFELADLTKESLEEIDGIGPTVAESIVEFFNSEDNLAELNVLWNYGCTFGQEIVDKPDTSDLPLSNKIFVLTGKLNDFTRNDAKDKIESLGGKFSGSISKKVDYLLCGEKAGSKLDKAKKLNITVIDEKTFQSMVGV